MSEKAMLHEADCLPEPGREEWPVGKKAAFFTLALSCAFAMLDFMDRQVLAALFPYLKQDLGFSDSQLGLLVSIVNISIAVFTVPTGFFIDRWSRKYMMGIMTFVWSLATGACYFAGTYAHLLMARFFVGAGEAGYVPASQSLISASFPEKYRSTALSIFVTSIGLGGPLGIIIGAFVAQHWGWRHAFGIVAIPGLIGAFLCIALKDFRVKKACDGGASVPNSEGDKQSVAHEPWSKVLFSVLKTPSCMLTFLALAGHNMFASVMVNWSISYFNREAHMDPTTASLISTSLWIGLAVGHIVTGIIMDKLRHSGGTPRSLTFVICCTLACFVMEFSAFWLCAPGSVVQVLLFTGGLFATGSILPMGYTVTADLTPPHHRGTATGLLTFIQNALGMSVGPLLAGILSDGFGLGTSMMMLSLMEIFVVFCWLGVRTLYHRDLARMDKVVVQF